MKIDLNNIPEPLNANERFLHSIVVRQNIIIEQLASIIEHITKERPVESKPVVNAEAKPKRTTRKRTSTKE
jgi:GTP cyclohydrolase III